MPRVVYGIICGDGCGIKDCDNILTMRVEGMGLDMPAIYEHHKDAFNEAEALGGLEVRKVQLTFVK